MMWFECFGDIVFTPGTLFLTRIELTSIFYPGGIKVTRIIVPRNKYSRISVPPGPKTIRNGYSVTPEIKSYIKDSGHLISLLESTPVPKDCLLVTIDVKSLYLNIPHSDGIKAVLNRLYSTKELADQAAIPQGTMTDLLNIVLQQNYFQFADKIYHQIQGTAMGTKMAPSYDNIFMAESEGKLLANYPIKPSLWKRYIDKHFSQRSDHRFDRDVKVTILQATTRSHLLLRKQEWIKLMDQKASMGTLTTNKHNLQGNDFPSSSQKENPPSHTYFSQLFPSFPFSK